MASNSDHPVQQSAEVEELARSGAGNGVVGMPFIVKAFRRSQLEEIVSARTTTVEIAYEAARALFTISGIEEVSIRIDDGTNRYVSWSRWRHMHLYEVRNHVGS